MAISLSDILAALQHGVQAINGLRTQVRATFPHISEFSITPPSAGGVSFASSQATAFMPITTSSGFTGYVALFPSS